MLRVGDVMRKHVLTVTPETSVRTAALKLLLFNVESLIVVEGEALVGIVTERDILAAAMPRIDDIVATGSLLGVDIEDLGRSHSARPLGDVMTRVLETTTPDTSVTKALGQMLAHRMRRLPVLDPGTGQLVGIVTQRDLLGLVYLNASEAVGAV